jgi:hypothetical protein
MQNNNSDAVSHSFAAQAGHGKSLPVGTCAWNRVSIAAIVLTVSAVVGRLASFLMVGPSSLTTLLLLGVVATAARTFAGIATSRVSASVAERRLVCLAKRVATMQMIIGAGLIVVSLA